MAPVQRAYLATDDHEARHALRLVLRQKLGIQVVGESAHTYGLTALVESAEASLLLIEWDLPGRVDARLLASLHALATRPRIVVLSGRVDAEACALAAGADAFVSKLDAPENLLAALRPPSILPG